MSPRWRGQHRARVASLGDEMAEMTPGQVQDLVSQIVERVETKDQRVVRVVRVVRVP
jgi:hypothetical protein